MKWRKTREPVLFKPLPDHTTTDPLAFQQCEAEVAHLLGLDVAPEPSRSYADRLHEDVGETLFATFDMTDAEFHDLGWSPDWLGPLVRAAVYDPDPSHNRIFIVPAFRAFGRRPVRAEILDYLRMGSNDERAGSARAWYWTLYPAWSEVHFSADGRPEWRGDPTDRASLREEWNEAAMREFVTNEDLDVRRNLIPQLVLHKTDRNREVHHLIDQTVRVARSHPDDYIRHRLDLQLRD